jgi:hypothetical protein
VRFDDLAHPGGGDHVGEAVAAEEQGLVRPESDLLRVDEPLLLGLVVGGAHVAEDLVAPRVAHGLVLGQLASVLPRADRRVVAGDLLDLASAEAVKAAVADVADRRLVTVEDRHRKHAGHAGKTGIGLGALEDLAVGLRDGLAHQAVEVRGAAGEAGAEDVERGLRRDLAAGLAADAVDHGIDAALGIAEDPVLVVLPLASRVGALGGDRS